MNKMIEKKVRNNIRKIGEAKGMTQDIHGLFHGLKIARQLLIFTLVCALKCCMVASSNHLDSDSLRGALLVPPFQVRASARKSRLHKQSAFSEISDLF